MPRGTDHPVVYYQGRNARLRGHAKMPPATELEVYRAWWLAGWHDADMEELAAGRPILNAPNEEEKNHG